MKGKMSVSKKILLFSVFFGALIMSFPWLKGLIKEASEEPVEYDIVGITKHESVSPTFSPTPTPFIEEDIEYEYKLDEFNEIIRETIDIKGIDINPFISINSKTLGALSVPGTNIYYPIVSSISDDEWTMTDFLGNKSYSGTIFLDYGSNSNLDNDVNILFGHNMGNGSMFAYLNRYLRNTNYLDKWNYMFLSTKDKIEVYTAFCANQITNNNGDYRVTNFDSNEEHKKYIDKIISEAKFSVYTPDTSAKIVQLTTCSSDNDFRSILYFSKAFEIPNILSNTNTEEITSRIKRITNDDEDYRDLFSNLIIYKIPNDINFLRITDALENNYDWSLDPISKEEQGSLEIEEKLVSGLDTFTFENVTFAVFNINGQRFLVTKEGEINLVFGTTLRRVVKEDVKTLVLTD